MLLVMLVINFEIKFRRRHQDILVTRIQDIGTKTIEICVGRQT